MPEKLE